MHRIHQNQGQGAGAKNLDDYTGAGAKGADQIYASLDTREYLTKSAPKTVSDPLGQGSGPTVVQHVLTKLQEVTHVENDTYREYGRRLRELGVKRAALVAFLRASSSEMLETPVQEVRDLLA